MSAEELANSYSGQNQNQNQPKLGDEFNKFQSAPIVGDKTAEELAAEFESGKQKVVDTNEEDDKEKVKTPEEIAAEAEKNKGGRPKTKLDDSFKQGLDKLFKAQKLDPYSDGTETGYIVPETWEDVIELLDENKKNWSESVKSTSKEDLLNEILATKSPAWQFLLQNADTYSDPAELVPLLTAVQNEEYSNSLDPTSPDDQEKIIRSAFLIQGLTTEAIQSEIEDLKERGKLENRAKDLKPILDRYNESQTEKILQQKQEEELKKTQFWNGYYQSLEQDIFKSKDLDGAKLKMEHKQLIASALIPDKELGGLPLYTMIDNLVAKGNFKVLSKIALLGMDEKLFDTYFLTQKADKKAESVQKTLRQQGTNSNPIDFESDEQKPKTIRKPYGYFG